MIIANENRDYSKFLVSQNQTYTNNDTGELFEYSCLFACNAPPMPSTSVGTVSDNGCSSTYLTIVIQMKNIQVNEVTSICTNTAGQQFQTASAYCSNPFRKCSPPDTSTIYVILNG